MMAQDFQQYELLNGGLVGAQVDSSIYGPSSKPRGLQWCYGIESDVAKEWSLQLNKNGVQESKLAAEASVEGGLVVVRSQSCPWSRMNLNNTNRIAATDPICFQRILEDALSPSSGRRPGRYTTLVTSLLFS